MLEAVVVEKKDPNTPKPDLSDEVAERVKAHIIHGDVGYGKPPI